MKDQDKPDSVISGQMTITGDISFRGLLRIDGVVDGSLRGERVRLGSGARLRGDIDLQFLDCYGVVDGRIRVNRLDLHRQGRISGGVAAVELSMEAGAELTALLGVVGAKEMEAVEPNRQGGRHRADFPEAAETLADELVNTAQSEPPPPQFQTLPTRPAPGESVFTRPSMDDGANEPGDDGKVADHGVIIDSLITALQGGSRLVVVVSDDRERRNGFCQLALARLVGHYRVIVIDDPGGSVKDILLRIAGRLGIDIVDQDSSRTIWEEIRLGFGDMAGGSDYLLFVEHGESMFPATLEGLLRLLADTTTDLPPPLILTGATDLKKMQDIDPTEASIWEPDCLFELPSS